MNNLEFKTEINASAENIWWCLWNDFSYRKWTSVFHEGSYAVSDWKQGSKIHFLGPDGGGMYSVIEEKTEFSQMTFKHIGEVKNFEEQPLDEKSKEWNGAIEAYNLQENNGITLLTATLQTNNDFISFFENVFPKALEIVKAQAESPEIQITTTINATIDKVWSYWNQPAHIQNWCSASDDWHVPSAINNLVVGGKFVTTMAARDGSVSFDFNGIYTEVIENKSIKYTIEGGRKVAILFEEVDNTVKVTETFDAENENPLQLQEYGWQSILNNFKKYTENN